MKDLKQKLTSTFNLLDITKQQMKEYLQQLQTMDDFPEVSKIMFFKQYLLREKSIFECLNKLSRQGSIVHGYVWSPLTKEKFLERFYGPE